MQKARKNLFFPNPNNFNQYCREIRKCEKRILVCMYQITHQKLVNTLIHLANRGREVYLITNSQKNDQRQPAILRNIFIRSAYKVKISVFDSEECLMHSKFCIIDDIITMVGSANWTYQAFRKNYESVLILKGAERAKEFLNEFERIWESSKEITLQGPNIIQFSLPRAEFQVDKKEQKQHKNNQRVERSRVIIDINSESEGEVEEITPVIDSLQFDIEIIL